MFSGSLAIKVGFFSQLSSLSLTISLPPSDCAVMMERAFLHLAEGLVDRFVIDPNET